MRNSSWRHARHRRNNVVKSIKRFKLERHVLGTTEDTRPSLKFSKRSIACKCKMCTLDREAGRRDKQRREHAIMDARYQDYILDAS